MANVSATCNNCKCPSGGVFTVIDYVLDSVSFPVPKEAVQSLCRKRNINGAEAYNDAVARGVKVELLRADILRWMVLGPSRVGSTTDRDNSWSHSGGGYTLTKDDKRMLLAEANAIYGELEPASVFHPSKITFHSFGVGRAITDLDGTPLPRIHHS